MIPGYYGCIPALYFWVVTIGLGITRKMIIKLITFKKLTEDASAATQLTRLEDVIAACCTSFHSATSIQVPAKFVCSLRLMNLFTVLRISRLDAPVCTSYEISPVVLVSISAQYGATRNSGELGSAKGDGQQEVSLLPNVKYPFVPT